MTVSATESTAVFYGNGVTTVFPFAFRFFADTNLVVTRKLADESTVTLTLGVDYTVQGANDLDGGSVTTIGMVLAADEELIVTRVLSPVQLTDLRNQGKFFAETHESAFDYLTMLIQQANGDINGAIRVAVGDPDPTRLPNAILRANLLMSFDGSGNPIAVAPVSGSATDLAINLANDTDPAKGAELVGYAGGTVADSLTLLGDDAQPNAALFRREMVIDLPFRDADYDYLIDTHSYPFLYPQAFAVDAVAGEVFVLRGSPTGNNNWAWIWVYDLETGVVKTRFTTGQAWRESLVLRREGGSRYLFTIGDSASVIKLDMSVLPANLSTVTTVATYPVFAQSFMTSDGDNWIVQDAREQSGISRRNILNIYDADFALTGRIVLPIDSIGTLSPDTTQFFPKAQGICVHNGAIYVATGGDYNSASPGSVALRYAPIKLQGIQAFSTSGSQLASALGDPELSRVAMESMVGRPCTVIEIEGLCSDGGELYSIWQTLAPTEWNGAQGLTSGIVIAKELSKSPERADFAGAARIVRSAVSIADLSTGIRHYSIPLKDPVTGGDLTSFQEIIGMMIRLNLPRYSYNGTNNTLVDLNNDPVSITSAVVEFENANGSTFLVKVRHGTGQREGEVVYVVTGAGTDQLGPFYSGAEVTTVGTATYVKHASGVLECFDSNVASVTVDIAAGAIFRSAGSLWTYPAPFLAGTSPIVTVSSGFGARFGGGTSAAPGATAATLFVYGYSADATPRPIAARAVGRWK